MSIINNLTKLNPKAIILTDEQFSELISLYEDQYYSDINPVSYNDGQSIDTVDKVYADPEEPLIPAKKRFGEYLMDAGLVTQEQVEEALVESKKIKLPIGYTLVKLGYITNNQLKAAFYWNS